MFLAVAAKFTGTVIWEDDIQIVCKWARFSKAPQRVAVSVTLNFITIVFVTKFGVNLKGRRSTINSDSKQRRAFSGDLLQAIYKFVEENFASAIKDDPKWKSRVNKTVNEKLGQSLPPNNPNISENPPISGEKPKRCLPNIVWSKIIY